MTAVEFDELDFRSVTDGEDISDGVRVVGLVRDAQSTTMVDLVVELLEQWLADDT